MQNNYRFEIRSPDLGSLGYLVAIANTQDKHDRSAPTHYHWKILKCRMIIFSNSSILACPDKKDIKQVHIIFNKKGDDYDKVVSLFLKFSLAQDGAIRDVTPETFQACFCYTLIAKLAPNWNALGLNYLVNNRDFLTSKGPQDGIKYHIWSNEHTTIVEVKPVKINFISSDEIFLPGEWIRVLPSLNKAVVEEYCESLPESGSFRCYKDLRRHWKNIHGYRLPEEECPYYTIRFWRGEPLTYPKICVVRNFPIVTPVPKLAEKIVLSKFLSCLRSRIPSFLGMPLILQHINDEHELNFEAYIFNRLSRNVYIFSSSTGERKFTVCKTKKFNITSIDKTTLSETQAISLCTPTQNY